MTAGKSNANDPNAKSSMTPELKRALDYLATRIEQIDEPYAIASYALARIDAGDSPGRRESDHEVARHGQGRKRRELLGARNEYAVLWLGTAGGIETTAMWCRRFALRHAGSVDQSWTSCFCCARRTATASGIQLRRPSTCWMQLLELFGHEINTNSTASRTATIVVNGREVKSIELPEPQRLANVITVDLSQFIQSGSNQIQLRRPPGSTPASMQAVASYYIPWSESVATQEANWRANGSSGLRL
jgi:hypothetical protein